MLGELGAFLAVAIIVIVTPGPDTALTIRNTLLGGRRGGAFTAFGVATGQASWTLATSAGIAALLVASEPAFRAVKVLGALYLMYLGLHAIRAAARARDASPGPSTGVAGPRLSPGRAYRQGLVSNLSNPKMAVFFPSLLPQFAADEQTTFVSLVPLGLVFCTMTLAWLAAYAIAVAKAGDLLRAPRVRRWFEATMGAVLLALGLRVATER